MKTPVLILAHIAALWILLISAGQAEKEPISSSAFASAYLKQLELVVGKMQITDRGSVNHEGSFFFNAIAPTFKLGLDPKNVRHTVFDDGKNGPMALFVFRTPMKLHQAFAGLDSIVASGDMMGKVLNCYVCCANADHFVLLVSETKKIPMDSEAVITLRKMLPSMQPNYWEMSGKDGSAGTDPPAAREDGK